MTLVLPGWQNSGEDHWQTLWEKKFGWKRVSQHDWEHPNKSAWIHNISEGIEKESTPPVLICHSLSCSALAHTLQFKPQLKVKAAFLVSPVNFDLPGIPPEILDFHPNPPARLPFPSMVVSSSTDPFCDLTYAENLARSWGSIFKNVGDRHHIGSMANLGAWEEGQKLLAELLN